MKSLLIILLFLSTSSHSQNRNSIWCFGDSAGIDFRNINNPVSFNTVMDGRGSCVSICDTSGNLLFYADTYTPLAKTLIWNAIHDTMNNANDSLIGDGVYNELQIVPFPDGTNKYYVFYTGIAGFFDGLYYLVIDMNLDNGLGSVISKHQQINNNRIADCLQAVKHGNGRDWWLITKLSSVNLTQINRFIVYLVTSSGVSQPVNYDFGGATDGDFEKIIFNSNCSRMMTINVGGYMAEFDFNRCTGIINNPQIIYPEQVQPYNRLFWEGSYSPSGDMFYVTSSRWINVNTSYLIQFDLTSANIPQSADTLDDTFQPVGTGAIRLAPDNKIYYSRAYENPNVNSFPYADSMRNYINENLSVIHSPDSLGAVCNFQPFSFYLGGKRTYYGLPNNPNYELGALIGSPCDTLSHVGILTIEEPSASELSVYYHPAWQTAFINAQKLQGQHYTLHVYDLLGQLIFTEQGALNSNYFTKNLNMQSFANGVYILSLSTEKQRINKKFVKQ